MGQTTTEDHETNFNSFPRGATALLGLLNYGTTRVGGAKQEEGGCAPAPDEPAPEESKTFSVGAMERGSPVYKAAVSSALEKQMKDAEGDVLPRVLPIGLGQHFP